MDRTDLIEQFVVIEHCGTSREDGDVAASKRAIENTTNSRRVSRNENATLVVHLADNSLLDMRRPRLYLDDARSELSRLAERCNGSDYR
jgi:hypothetical protein